MLCSRTTEISAGQSVACLPTRSAPIPIEDALVADCVVHLGLNAAGEDDIQRIIPLPGKVDVCSWHNLVSLGATRDARPDYHSQEIARLFSPMLVLVSKQVLETVPRRRAPPNSLEMPESNTELAPVHGQITPSS